MWGIYGFIWAMVLYVFIAALTFNVLSSYYLKVSLFKQVKDVLVNLAIFVIPLFVVVYLKENFGDFNSFVRVLLPSSVYIGISIALVVVVKPQALIYLKSKVKKKLK